MGPFFWKGVQFSLGREIWTESLKENSTCGMRVVTTVLVKSKVSSTFFLREFKFIMIVILNFPDSPIKVFIRLFSLVYQYCGSLRKARRRWL